MKTPDWVRGGVDEDDAKFLRAMVVECRPTVAVEIGVAAGVSTAVLLDSLSAWQGVLHSYDPADVCYFDRQRKIGAAIEEMGVPMERWLLHKGTAETAADEL